MATTFAATDASRAARCARVDQRPGQVPLRQRIPLDPRRGDGFGPEQERPDRLEAGNGARSVQLTDRLFRRGDGLSSLERRGRIPVFVTPGSNLSRDRRA